MRKFTYIDSVCLYIFQLLLLFAFHLKVNDLNSIHKLDTILRLTLPNESFSSNKYIKIFSAPQILKDWIKEGKIFITIYLTGKPVDDKKRFDLIRNEARRLKYTCDTTHILKVHFMEQNTYGQFVALVNLMIEDNHERYLFFDDDFYILEEPPSNNVVEIVFN